MAKKRFVELEGNPTFTDRKTVANIEQNFVNFASKNSDITWILRQQGFGKKNEKQWADARKDVYVLGATKTKEDYYKRKALGNKKGGLPKYDPQKAVPRTTAGATFYHAGKRFNLNLQKELSESNLSDADKNTEYHSRKIKFQVEPVKPSDITHFKNQGKGDKSFALAAERRDKKIASYKADTARITQSGEFEGADEFNARMMFEGIQEGRKATKLSHLEKAARYGLAEDGQPKLVPSSIQITDEFIDAVNSRSFGTVKEERAFKAGALKLLQNKESYRQIHTPGAITFTPQRLEDTRSWHSGSLINPLRQGIAAQQELNLPSALQHGEDSYSKPNYRIVKGQVDTEYTGSTLITGETVTGPETPETVTLASSSSQSDYGASIDEELDMKASSFENMRPDEATKDFNYAVEDKQVPVQITSSAEELQFKNEPTIHETVVERTKGGDWSWENSRQATLWKDSPGKIYDAELVDTGKTAADLNLKAAPIVQHESNRSPKNYFSLTGYPNDVSSLISSSMSRVVTQGAPEYDAVQSYLQGDSFTEEDGVGQKSDKPPVKKGAPGLLESYRESSDVISIDDAAEKGFRSKKSIITSAFPAQFEGQTSINASTPKNEATTAMPGSDPKYVMTPDDIAREQRLGRAEAAGQGVGVKAKVTKKNVGGGYVKVYTDPKTPMSKRDAMIQFGELLTKKKTEYNARIAAGTQESFIKDLKPKKPASVSKPVKTPETIELHKSRTTGEYDTKKNIRKKGFKALAKKAKGPGSTTFNALGAITLMSPLIGAYGSLKKTNEEEAESQSAYPLYKVKPRGITAGDYKQSLWHRLAPSVFRSVKEERKYKKSLIGGDA